MQRNQPPTPEKPPSDLKLLRKFMVWKLFNIDLEVSWKVFEKFWCMIKFYAVPYGKKIGHSPKISNNF